MQPWLQHYDPGVPHTIDVPPIALPDMLSQAAKATPDAPAIIFFGTQISYRELDRLATRCAHGLIQAGVQPGERVALLLPNVPQAVFGFFGALRAGAIITLANPISEAGSLIRQLIDADCRSILALSMFHPLVKLVCARTAIERVIFTNLKEYLPSGQRQLFTLFRQDREGHRVPEDQAASAHWLKRLLDQAPEVALPTLQPQSPAVLLYTGGTTGEAKGVVHTHRSLVANALQTRSWLPNARQGEERMLCALPFSHAYGMTACMNVAVTLGAAMILLPTFETAPLLAATRRHRPTIFPGVPPMYAAISEVPDARKYGLSSLHACISGAAPLAVEVQEGFERVTKARLVEGYGLTEAGPVTHANPISDRDRHGFIGLPLPSTEAKIVDLTSGADVPPGTIGELLVRGPQLMQGYWNNPVATAETFTADGWLRTGDVGRMEADGFFQVIERKKEMIIAGRYNIYPRDIEEVLYEHPKVLDAAVAGVPEGGETKVKAFVVLRNGESATPEELIHFLRDRISHYKLPSAVEFRNSLPRSFIGKVLRRLLTDPQSEKQPE